MRIVSHYICRTVETKWNVTQFATHPKTLNNEITIERPNVVASTSRDVPIPFLTNERHARFFYGAILPVSVLGVTVTAPFFDSLIT